MAKKYTNKFLIVDDSEPNRVLLQAILSNAGFDSDIAENGLECVEYCENKIPKMILLDIMMPKMDGIEACTELRKKYSKDELPIILVTTKSEGRDIAHGLEVGANDYVTKPVDRHILIARIQSCLSLIETQQALLLAGEQTEKALLMQSVTGDALTDAIAVHDSSGELIYANKALKNLCGGQRPESIEDVFQLSYYGLLEQKLSDVYQQQLKSSHELYDEEIEVRGEELFTYQVNSRPLPYRLDEGLRLWVWRDLTHIKNLERRINQRIRLDTVGLFASGVAHNFNNILGGILGASELLSRSEDSRVLRCKEIIQKAVRGGMKLTDKMSVLVRKAETDGSGECANFTRLLNEIISDFEPDTLRAIDIENKVPDGLSLNMATDNLRDILSNLLSNAIDAVIDGGTISCSLKDELTHDKAMVTLSIKDSGVGMDAHMLERAFEPFFSTKNLDEANKVSVAGNGLGLWNVYHLVKRHEGDIRFESSPNSGTEVLLTLPVRVDPMQEENGVAI